MNNRAVVLLSGGMDSAVALFWAASSLEVVGALNFDYGQRGAGLEWKAANRVMTAYRAVYDMSGPLTWYKLNLHVDSALTIPDAPLGQQRHGLPSTFVPGRNMIFIAHAAAVAWEVDARYIIGGWSGVDTDYPDCSEKFLQRMSHAASTALGRTTCPYGLLVKSPLSTITKAEAVTLGVAEGVPFGLTRSCYDFGQKPCMQCDSCIKRVDAFIVAGVRDPLVASTAEGWSAFVHDWEMEHAQGD